MFEHQCYIIDIKIAATKAVSNNELPKQDFDAFVKACSLISELETSISQCEHSIYLVHQAIAFVILQEPENKDQINAVYQPRIIHYTNKIKEKVN